MKKNPHLSLTLMAISLPTLTWNSIFSPHPHSSRKWILQRPASKPFLCSSSLHHSTLMEDSPPSDAEPAVPDFTPQSSEEKLPLSGCKACGREEIEKGCNGEGRIQGGIATVPGFGWWPIKAFRPCPRFVASGGRYRRRGQSMDEVAFGREGPQASASTRDKSSKKKQSP